MRKAIVYLNLDAVGTLTETSKGSVFQYDERYIAQPNARALSLTLPISS